MSRNDTLPADYVLYLSSLARFDTLGVLNTLHRARTSLRRDRAEGRDISGHVRYIRACIETLECRGVAVPAYAA